MALIRPDLDPFIGADIATRGVHELAGQVVVAEAISLRTSVFTNKTPDASAVETAFEAFVQQYGPHVEAYGEPYDYVFEADGEKVAPLSAAINLAEQLDWDANEAARGLYSPKAVKVLQTTNNTLLREMLKPVVFGAPARLSERDFIAFSRLGIGEAGIEVPEGIQRVLMEAYDGVPETVMSDSKRVHRYHKFSAGLRSRLGLDEKLFEVLDGGKTIVTTRAYYEAMQATKRCIRDGVTLAGYPLAAK